MKNNSYKAIRSGLERNKADLKAEEKSVRLYGYFLGSMISTIAFVLFGVLLYKPEEYLPKSKSDPEWESGMLLVSASIVCLAFLIGHIIAKLSQYCGSVGDSRTNADRATMAIASAVTEFVFLYTWHMKLRFYFGLEFFLVISAVILIVSSSFGLCLYYFWKNPPKPEVEEVPEVVKQNQTKGIYIIHLN